MTAREIFPVKFYPPGERRVTEDTKDFRPGVLPADAPEPQPKIIPKAQAPSPTSNASADSSVSSIQESLTGNVGQPVKDTFLPPMK